MGNDEFKRQENNESKLTIGDSREANIAITKSKYLFFKGRAMILPFPLLSRYIY